MYTGCKIPHVCEPIYCHTCEADFMAYRRTMTIYTIWDSDTGKCIGKDVDLVRAMSLLAELPSETAAEFLEQAGPPGSIALERYGFTVMVNERNSSPRYVQITLAVPVYEGDDEPDQWVWETLLDVPNSVVVVDSRDVAPGERIIDMHGNGWPQDEL